MPTSQIKLGIVGVGKIVRDQHLPSIAGNESYQLIATASRNASVDGIAAYSSIEQMCESTPELDAVALCTPPQYRYAAARYALERGLHVLLEKPPGASVSEVEQLAALAEQNGLSVYATWHSRCGVAVEVAKNLLATTEIKSVTVNWKEDVKKWHPGQQWIWQAGGLGVFDPGINGLSILTHILPVAVFVKRAQLAFPANKAAPIAAKVTLSTAEGLHVEADFDWRESTAEVWSIEVDTADGKVQIVDGGAAVLVDGTAQATDEPSKYSEYQTIYRRFSDLIASGHSDADLQPLKLVADAFLLAERQVVDAFTG